jgi:hypothetical protein
MTTKLLKIAVLALTAALPCACGVRENAPEEFTGKIVFTASGADAKTAFASPENGYYPCLWTGNNECVALNLNWAEKQVAAVEASEDGRSASFELEFEAVETQKYAFAALSPASAVIAASSSRQAWSICLPVRQHPLPNSPDEAAQLISAVSTDYSTMPTKVSLGFSHISAYGRLAISGLQNGDAAIRSVELTSSVPFAGQWYFNPADGSLTDNGASSTIELETDSVDDVWFSCLPCEMSGQTLTVSVLTEAGRYSKTIRPREGLAFLPGKVARIAVDFSGIEAESSAEVFTLVTDISTLAVGDEVLIVNLDGDYALGDQVSGSSKYRNRAAVQALDGVIETPGDATVLTLGQGNSADSWTLKDGNVYLCSTSSGNYLTTSTSVSNNSSWKISRSGSTTKIEAKAGGSRFIMYNSSSPRFSCYKNTSTSVHDICIYRKGSGTAPVDDDPMLAYDQYGLNIGGMQRFYTPGTDQYVRQYDDAGSSQTFVILEAEGKEQVEISGYTPSMRNGDSATFSICWRKGLSTQLNGNWTLTLVREDGPKVWLSDGRGGGVIIKK